MSASHSPAMSHDEADLREELASLSEFAFEQRKKELEKRYGIGAAALGRMWKAAHCDGTPMGDKLAGKPISSILKVVEPWPEPVDISEWLSDCESELRRYLAMPEGAHLATAAWSAYTHAYEHFGYAPYIVYVSPAPERGKTTALRAKSQLVRLPLSTGALTTATLFRVVDEHRPTLLCDEQDGRLERNPEMHRLFNEGFHRGGFVLRCVGDDNEPRAFQVFGPKALRALRVGSSARSRPSRSSSSSGTRAPSAGARASGLAS